MHNTQEQSDHWLTLPEAADALGVELRAVRGMLTERRLVAVRRGPNKAWSVPRTFLVLEGDGAAVPGAPTVLPSLRGTVIQLGDAGYDDEEILAWLEGVNDELGEAPIIALRAGRTHAVRRAAQSLAF